MDYVIILAISWVISFPILILSMIATNSLLGGDVEFGPLGPALLKGSLLVILGNVILLFVPFGLFLWVVVFWLGTGLLFRVEFWQARVFVLVNWVLNIVVSLLLMQVFK
jgi:hypothetical protein